MSFRGLVFCDRKFEDLLVAMIRSVVKSFEVVDVVAARMSNKSALTHMTDLTLVLDG